MADRHQVDTSEVGQVRQGERRKRAGKGLENWLSGSPLLYRETFITDEQE
ncbi:hypothetical protein SAMN02745119_01008 [Trichlorobacter thiogenes]|uniref:Uncharacterized protein n=1 Tax=Trichlorobacter thiogenes TaxID=115783 RepID=A0A1T4LQA9_9BACT|nr:hypothetical protein [Trichlorobacter thiogenes]SJZ56929.1 hypothetical protein SAMN02745119_01008 [Trichlorobacter thiogenes]